MTSYRVDCINKRDRFSPFERIDHLGGEWPFHWKHTEDEVIRGILDVGDDYFTMSGSRQIPLAVIDGGHRKYLRSKPDGLLPDNLLSLPECSLLL